MNILTAITKWKGYYHPCHKNIVSWPPNTNNNFPHIKLENSIGVGFMDIYLLS
jgi:hypothetical protein